MLRHESLVKEWEKSPWNSCSISSSNLKLGSEVFQIEGFSAQPIAMTKTKENPVGVLGLAPGHDDRKIVRFIYFCRYVTPASQSHISHECSPFRWAISCKREIAPLLNR